MWHFAIAPVSEALATGIQRELRVIVFPVEVDDSVGAVRAAVGAAARVSGDAIDDGIFDNTRGVERVGDFGMFDMVAHAQV